MKKINHSYHQTDLPIEMQILNISVNMARVGRKMEDSNITNSNMEFIERLIRQTRSYLNDLSVYNVPDRFKPTLKKFKSDFNKLKKEPISKKNNLYWSEKALTWADILQIRSKLA